MPIKGEDFVNFCGLLRKHELYTTLFWTPKKCTCDLLNLIKLDKIDRLDFKHQ